MKTKIAFKLFLKDFLLIYLTFLFPITVNLYASQLTEIKLEEKSISSKNNNSLLKSEYILGSGDVLFIEFKGLEIFSNFYAVNPNGELFLPELNYIKTSNLTIIELSEKLHKEYQKIIVNPDITIKITEYRPVNFYVTGEVKNPGLYKLDYNSKATNGTSIINSNKNKALTQVPKLFDVIKTANGVTNRADLSKVSIIRNNSITQGGGKIKAEINFLNLIINGDQSQNERIYDGDIITIPKSDKLIKEQILAINQSNLSPNEILVYITGNVKNPGPVKLKKGSSLIQSIASTGGKKIMTGNIEFIRFRDDGTSIKQSFKYDENAKINSYRNPILSDGDIINVQKTLLGYTSEVIKEVGSPVIAAYGLIKIFD